MKVSMKLPILPPFAPMEARLTGEIPMGSEWQYEPKWDGFRCLAFRSGKEVELQSKSGQPLTRYFPEVVAALLDVKASKFVLDGELILPVNGHLSFDDLLQRIHPAESRIEKLSHEHPATLVVFDLLADANGASLVSEILTNRRRALEAFYSSYLESSERFALSRATLSPEMAHGWLDSMRGQLDGIVAKQTDQTYLSGERAMLKVKTMRSADCVVGGFRYGSGKDTVGSLLLGLYDDSGRLNHVGYTSSMPAASRKGLTMKLESLVEAPGFTGQAPGGPSRWSTDRSSEWRPLRPELVVEVQYDHFTGARFRHGTKLLRWRPDKGPRECTMEQVEFEAKASISNLLVAR
jgi:ATP-dependent DNA ligase